MNSTNNSLHGVYILYLKNGLMNESWGRNSYARAMIEIDAESELKESITCSGNAPKRKSVHVQDDGFEVVKGKNKGKKQVERNFVVKPKTTLVYKQVTRQNVQGSSKRKQDVGNKSSNPFSVLANESSSGTNEEGGGPMVGNVKQGIVGVHDEYMMMMMSRANS
ncbi:hypothetical protein Tco_1180577 [Tanacetum coccineum]